MDMSVSKRQDIARDRKAWHAAVHVVAKSWKWLGNWTATICMHVVVVVPSSAMSDSLWLHGLQHARLSCPSPSLTVYSSSWPLNQWCHPTISSSVIVFSFCLQSFPASGSFQMSQCFTSGGQNIGASSSALALPMNNQGWFPLGLTVTIWLVHF